MWRCHCARTPFQAPLQCPLAASLLPDPVYGVECATCTRKRLAPARSVVVSPHKVLSAVPDCSLEAGSDPRFTCERVCTSDRLLRRMGGLSKVPCVVLSSIYCV